MRKIIITVVCLLAACASQVQAQIGPTSSGVSGQSIVTGCGASNGQILYDNAGNCGGLSTNGSGNVLLSAGTVAVASGKTATFSNSITFAGTDGTTETFPTTSKTLAANDLSNVTLSGSCTNASAVITCSPSITTQYFTASANTTYTPNAKLLYAIVECVGQGGGGGGAAASATGTSSGGGGGAGGYSRVRLTAAQIGASQAVTNTAAANGGTTGNNAGGSGNDTSLGTLCVAKGGSGGAGAATTADGAGGAGGVGSSGTGDFKITGSAGTRGEGGTILTVVNAAGLGAEGPWGGSPAGVQGSSSAVAGNAGGGCGAGGGGGQSTGSASTAAGGAGAAGCILITEYNSQ